MRTNRLIATAALPTLLIALLIALPAAAFDGSKSGFMVGAALGYGGTEVDWQSGGFDRTESANGLATDLRLGICASDRVWLYVGNRALFYEGNTPDDLSSGLASLGTAWFFRPGDVPLFLVIEAGAGVRRNRITAEDEMGFGYSFGWGMELRPHWALEVNYLAATVEDEPGPERNLRTMSVSFGWIGY